MKLSNIVVIGGPISAGKSTLVEKLPYPKVYELDYSDEILMFLWEATYAKNRVAPETIEYYFLKLREKRYQAFSDTDKLNIFDRSVFESIIFAKENLSEKSYKLFYKLWLNVVKTMIKKYGKPKLYILLSINWETFQARFFKRDNKIETKHFETNKSFFQSHIQQYITTMSTILKKFKINFLVIKTDDLSIDAVNSQVTAAINDLK